ncbi:tellurium resistance protein TerE [Priestia megaterium]|uniref:TerD family protein n=1 Tax=Priestia megaterium TaxID=1404 RepID=UPI000BF8D39B|nr:TerD family protein [Priestia megaterium]PFK99828.1 tellurium resistance protein TerE [Priestia megaterium]
MAISLHKIKAGESVELTKENAGLRHVTLGLRWGGLVEKKEEKPEKVSIISAIFGGGRRSSSSSQTLTSPVDVDSAVVMVDADGRKLDRVYFAKRHAQGVYHAGDDRSGNNQFGKEDNEEIYVKLEELHVAVKELYVIANIYTGANDFSDSRLSGSYVRLLNSDTNEELVRYELDEFKGMRGVVLGKLYKHNSEWKFKALGQGVKSGSIDSIENAILR